MDARPSYLNANNAVGIALRLFLVITLAVLACIAAGLIAVRWQFPSLFNAVASFEEYAYPHLFSWASAHIISLLVLSWPLLIAPLLSPRFWRIYRIVCLVLIVLSLLLFAERVPFLLFAMIDATLVLIVSLVMLPPDRKTQPRLWLVCLLAVGLLSLSAVYWAVNTWRYRLPELQQTSYLDDQFTLSAIELNSYEQRIYFKLQVHAKDLSSQNACAKANKVAFELVADYAYPSDYERMMVIADGREGYSAIEIGELNLNPKHQDPSGNFACYFKVPN